MVLGIGTRPAGTDVAAGHFVLFGLFMPSKFYPEMQTLLQWIIGVRSGDGRNGLAAFELMSYLLKIIKLSLCL